MVAALADLPLPEPKPTMAEIVAGAAQEPEQPSRAEIFA